MRLMTQDISEKMDKMQHRFYGDECDWKDLIDVSLFDLLMII